jgi:hypothetical protein
MSGLISSQSHASAFSPSSINRKSQTVYSRILNHTGQPDFDVGQVRIKDGSDSVETREVDDSVRRAELHGVYDVWSIVRSGVQ